MGRVSFGVVVVLVAALSTGCAQVGGGGVACPAIAYLNNLTVNLEGDASAVAEVQGCVDGVCSQVIGPPTEEAPFETVQPPGSSSTPRSSPAPTQDLSILPYTAVEVEMDRWVINFGMSAPEEVTVRVLGAEGEVFAEDVFALEWVRVGGSEECGGPMETDPVTLLLP